MVSNASKSVCLRVTRVTSKASKIFVDDLQFTLVGNRLDFTDACSHLGHVLTSRLDDKSDILIRRHSLCHKVNNVLCYLFECDPVCIVGLVSLLYRRYLY